MTRRPLVSHPSVEDHIAAIYDHYELFDPALLGRFEPRLDEPIDRIETFAEPGADLFEPYRRQPTQAVALHGRLAVRDDRIDVLAVIGVQRDPERVETTVSERGDE